MSPDITKLVIIPRFSSFVGSRAFTTQPMPVRDYATANIYFWRTQAFGTSPTVAIAVQQSADVQLWWDVVTSSGTPSDAEVIPPLAATFTMDWMRFKLTLGGANPAISCWAVGDFRARAK